MTYGIRGPVRATVQGLVALAIVAVAGAWAWPAALDRTEPVFPFEYEKLVLDNGFTA
jgi:hypothetical protein